MLNEKKPRELLDIMVGKVSEIMGIMDMFEDSRPGSLAFTHFEEGMMWLQVLTHNIQLKKREEAKEAQEHLTKEEEVVEVVLTQKDNCC